MKKAKYKPKTGKGRRILIRAQSHYNIRTRKPIIDDLFERFEEEEHPYGFISDLANEFHIPRTTVKGWYQHYLKDQEW